MNIEWNYENFDYAYYDSLTSNEMKEFMGKYYPIGMVMDFVEKSKLIKEKRKYDDWKPGKISSYEIHNTTFNIIVCKNSYHPAHFKPSAKHIRNEKLKQLGI